MSNKYYTDNADLPDVNSHWQDRKNNTWKVVAIANNNASSDKPLFIVAVNCSITENVNDCVTFRLTEWRTLFNHTTIYSDKVNTN